MREFKASKPFEWENEKKKEWEMRESKRRMRESKGDRLIKGLKQGSSAFAWLGWKPERRLGCRLSEANFLYGQVIKSLVGEAWKKLPTKQNSCCFCRNKTLTKCNTIKSRNFIPANKSLDSDEGLNFKNEGRNFEDEGRNFAPSSDYIWPDQKQNGRLKKV